MGTDIIVRVRSRTGVKRVECESDTLLGVLKAQIASLVGIMPDDQRLALGPRSTDAALTNDQAQIDTLVSVSRRVLPFAFGGAERARAHTRTSLAVGHYERHNGALGRTCTEQLSSARLAAAEARARSDVCVGRRRVVVVGGGGGGGAD